MLAATPSTGATHEPATGRHRPDFSLDSTEGPLHFNDYADGHWVVFFSHPKDFTPVCTTGLGAFARRKSAFDARNSRLPGLSVDSVADHQGWAKDVEDVGGSAINYPLLADPEREVAKRYGMFHPKADPKITVRSVLTFNSSQKPHPLLTSPCEQGEGQNQPLSPNLHP